MPADGTRFRWIARRAALVIFFCSAFYSFRSMSVPAVEFSDVTPLCKIKTRIHYGYASTVGNYFDSHLILQARMDNLCSSQIAIEKFLGSFPQICANAIGLDHIYITGQISDMRKKISSYRIVAHADYSRSTILISGDMTDRLYVHTFAHEFSHIMIGTYGRDTFKKWASLSTYRGYFFSDYASTSPLEDMAETIAALLMGDIHCPPANSACEQKVRFAKEVLTNWCPQLQGDENAQR
jgi:hypothetical protein